MQEIPSFGSRLEMKILIDSDMVLELFLNRRGFVEEAEKLFLASDGDEHNKFYIMEKSLKRIHIEQEDTSDQFCKESAHEIEKLKIHIVPHNNEFRELARCSNLRDFDSAEELACATMMGLDAIVTLNPQNFNGASLPIWSVDNLLVRLTLQKNLKAEYSPRISFKEEPGYELTRKADVVLASQLPKVTSFKASASGWVIPPGWHPNNYFRYLQFWDPQESWSN